MNSSLYKIYGKGIISFKCWVACKSYNLNSIEELKQYKNENENFLKLHGIGEKENAILCAICEQGENLKLPIKSDQQIHSRSKFLDELLKNKIISKRTYNVCINNSLTTFQKIIEYKFNNEDFYNLRNIGLKSNEELIQLCNQNKDNYVNHFENGKIIEYSLKDLISKLTRTEREVINSHIIFKTKNLSVRSYNALTSHLNNNLKIRNFAEKLLYNKIDFDLWNNVGIKSTQEIEQYLNNITEFIMVINEIQENKHLITKRNKYLFQLTFPNLNVPNEILESESIFLIVDFLLKQNALFEETQTEIVKIGLKIYQNQKKLTLADIALKVNLTRERVRQIRKECIDKLFDKLLFIQNFSDDLFQKYNIKTNSNHLEIDKEIVDEINKRNNTNLSSEFITYILFVYLWDRFSLVGPVEDVLQLKFSIDRNRYNWKNFYLVQKDIVTELDFKSLAKDIDNRINEKIEESYSFNFKSYLSKFLTNNNIDILGLLFPICEKIINEEFEIYLDLEENISFKRNTYRKAYEYAYEALEHLGKPSNVREVLKRVKELHPNYDTNEAKIRVSMNRKNGFVPIGRQSVFGLKKWEKELENFKGGTIRELVIQFLEKYDCPIHISSIVKEVNKYRAKTNEKNIISNLKLDSSNSFVIFNQKFIGLTNKKNHYDLSKYENLPVQLGKYIMGKYKSGYSINDIKLHCKEIWDLTIEEAEFIIQNLNYFNQTKTHTVNNTSFQTNAPKIGHHINKGRGTKYSLDNLIDFITEKRRMPYSRDPIEKNLYQFYYRNKKDLEKVSSLNSKQLELKKLIEQYGRSSRGTKYSLDNLIDFITEKRRMPDSRDPIEKNLYQFYYRNKKDLEKVSSLNSKQLELKKLIEQYGRSSRGTKYSLDNLIDFITEKRRMPDSRDPIEKNLYQFYYRKQKLYNQYKLDPKEASEFNQVAKLLQNIKYENKRN